MENERGTKMKKLIKLLAILMLVLPTVTTPVTVLARGGGARSGGARSGGARSGGSKSGGSKSGGSKSGGSKSGGSKSGSNKTPKPKTETPKPKTETPKPKTETPKPKTETPKPKTETPKPKTETPKSNWTPPVANFNTRNFNANSWSQPFTQPTHRSWSDNLLLWYALFHNNGPRTTNVYNTNSNPLGTNNDDWSNTSRPIGPIQQNYTQNNEDIEKKEKTDWKKIASIGALIGLPLILTALIFVFKR